MEKRKVTYKEILLIIGYIIIIGAYEFVEHFALVPVNSLLGVFLGFSGIIGITLVYLVFVQKEPLTSIIYQVKGRLRYMVIPAFAVFMIIASLPFFVPAKSNLFTIIVVLVMIVWGLLTLKIMSKLSKQKEIKDTHKPK